MTTATVRRAADTLTAAPMLLLRLVNGTDGMGLYLNNVLIAGRKSSANMRLLGEWVVQEESLLHELPKTATVQMKLVQGVYGFGLCLNNRQIAGRHGLVGMGASPLLREWTVQVSDLRHAVALTTLPVVTSPPPLPGPLNGRVARASSSSETATK